MGAGASAPAGMPMDKRREMYKVLKDQYTLEDLDALAAEEKQAWLDVRDMEASASTLTGDGQIVASDTPSAEELPTAQQRRSSSIVRVAAAAAAAASVGAIRAAEKVEHDGNSGEMRPQSKATRMSCHLPPHNESPHSSVSTVIGESMQDGSREGQGEVEGGVEQKVGGTSTSRTSCSSADIPAWRRAAEEVETAVELCVGDVVRVRDQNYGGMRFEGILTAIHDADTYTVELTTSADDPDSLDCITVGSDDIVRVMPWFCIEVGDSVECQPEGDMAWYRGTVLRVIHSAALYVVRLGEGPAGGDQNEGDEGEVLEVPESMIRKLTSGRAAITRRWKKIFHAHVATQALASQDEAGTRSTCPVLRRAISEGR